MLIPWEKLSEEALNNLIREFVLREGTDYGSIEQTLQTKERQVKNQIKAKEIFVVFNSEDETASILTKDQLIKLKAIK